MRSGFSTLQTASSPLTDRLPLGLANGVLSFAYSNIEYLLGELDGITRTFGHESIMPRICQFDKLQMVIFQTEALPTIR